MGRVPGLEPWKIETKWNGTPSTRKNYTEKVEGTLKRFPEMMATWQSRLTEGYTVENFAYLTHEFAKERPKQRMRDAGFDSATIIMETSPGGKYFPVKLEPARITAETEGGNRQEEEPLVPPEARESSPAHSPRAGCELQSH